MAKFPQLGAIVTKELSKIEGVKLRIKLLGPGRVRAWALQAQKLNLNELKRVAALRKETTKENAPELWEEGFTTPDKMEGDMDLARGVLMESLVGIDGLTIGDIDLGAEKEVKVLVKALEDYGLLESALMVAMTAQTPITEQLLF